MSRAAVLRAGWLRRQPMRSTSSPTALRRRGACFGFDPLTVMVAGLGVALASTLPSILGGMAFMQSVWVKTGITVIGKVGTPLLFDVGLYLLVLDITLKIVFSLAEENPI